MPRLSQCVPTLEIQEFSIVNTPQNKIKKELLNIKEVYNTLDRIQEFVNLGGDLFQSNFGVIGDVVRNEYSSNLNKIFRLYESIPDKYGKLHIQGLSRYSKNGGYSDDLISVEKRLSIYPMTTVNAIKSLADKLNMIIIPIEFVDLAEIFKEIEKSDTDRDYRYSYSYFTQNVHYKAIENAKENLKRLKASCNMNSYMYILCPMSYYSFWNEISSTLNIDKYYPIALENIFMTIDLMLPAQRNLYAMSKSNEANYKNLSSELERNIQTIHQTLKNMESRVSTLESQMTIVRQRQKEQEIEISRLKEVEAKMQQIIYRLLDPLVFYVHNEPINFRDNTQLERKAHLVSCFGPEFPVEFLESNGIMLYNMKDILNFEQ